jgi:hypothetical protein
MLDIKHAQERLENQTRELIDSGHYGTTDKIFEAIDNVNNLDPEYQRWANTIPSAPPAALIEPLKRYSSAGDRSSSPPIITPNEPPVQSTRVTRQRSSDMAVQKQSMNAVVEESDFGEVPPEPQKFVIKSEKDVSESVKAGKKSKKKKDRGGTINFDEVFPSVDGFQTSNTDNVSCVVLFRVHILVGCFRHCRMGCCPGGTCCYCFKRSSYAGKC